MPLHLLQLEKAKLALCHELHRATSLAAECAAACKADPGSVSAEYASGINYKAMQVAAVSVHWSLQACGHNAVLLWGLMPCW